MDWSWKRMRFPEPCDMSWTLVDPDFSLLKLPQRCREFGWQDAPLWLPWKFATLLTTLDVKPSLVGGISTPLKNMKVNWDDDILSIWNIKKWSKPIIYNHSKQLKQHNERMCVICALVMDSYSIRPLEINQQSWGKFFDDVHQQLAGKAQWSTKENQPDASI